MRICYLADTASVHTTKWVRYFLERGHNVHVITASAGEGAFDDRTHVLRLPVVVRGVRPFLAPPQIRRIVKRIAPQVLHAHNVSGYGFWGARTGFHPFVLTAWGSDVLVTASASRAATWMAKYALERADLITCDAHHIRRPLIALGARPEKVQIVNFGVDTRKFSPVAPGTSRATPPPFVIISLRSFYPVYDVGTLIRAFALVVQHVPDSRVVLIGDGEERGQLEQLARDLGVGDRVLFGGRVPNDSLPVRLHSAQVYVSTSLSDAGIAASTAEAMACGLPVVITDFGDNGRWVKNGEGGFLFRPGDHEALAQAIVWLLTHEGARSAFGRVNRTTIEQHNDYEKEMAKMERLYEELCVQPNAT